MNANTIAAKTLLAILAGSALGQQAPVNWTAADDHQNMMEQLGRSEEHTSELQSLRHLVFRLLLEKKDQLDFPVLYTNDTVGTATTDIDPPGENLRPLFDAIVDTIPFF